jgi:uracil-DNA glycosylase family 4
VKHKVWGTCDAKTPEIILLGEAPGGEEDEAGVPFVGAAGRTFKSAVEDVGHLWHRAHKTNIVACRFPKNNEKSPEALEAIPRCRPGLHEELRQLWEKGTTVIVAAGASAMHGIGIDGSIHKLRGSVFMLRWREAALFLDGWKDGYVLETTEKGPADMLCIPTFHPAFLSWAKDPRHEVTFCNDLEKAYNIAAEGWSPPGEHFSMFPTIEELEAWTDELLQQEQKPLLGIDLETSGFVPGHAATIVVGVATDGEHAFSIPFLKKGGEQYWPYGQRGRAENCLMRLMDECPTLFQNALFDGRHLRHLNTPAEIIQHDTMILHHCINPELPHNLGYIVSVYGRTPYWKGEVLNNAKAMMRIDDEQLRRYNLRDSVVLHQVLDALIADAKENGTYEVYEKIAMPLVKPVMQMIENGMLVDQKRLKKWKTTLKIKETKQRKKLRQMAELPEGFNLDSGDHLRYLLYGVEPTQLKKARKELAAYDEPGSRKKKNTKKYRELSERVATFDAVQPFPRLRFTPKKTESGSLSVDEEALLNIQTAAINRISRLKDLRKPTAAHTAELERVEMVRDWVSTYRTYKEVEKLITTYTSFPTGSDGRVHSPYRITGTNTGRLASGNRKGGEAGNMQNIPPEAKHIFVAPEGCVLGQLDYSNLELRVLAHISGDEVLKDIFRRGLNVHTENCKAMFGIDEQHPLWKSARRACKTYIFGRNYGGGLKGIHSRVVKAVPELNLTYAHFCEIDKAYRAAHPAYERWYNETVKTVQQRRWLKNAFGRVRYFLGTPYNIVKEGLNFPIQSTAADIINTAMIDLHRRWEIGEIQAKMIGQVHDSLLFELPKSSYRSELRCIKKVMEQPVQIAGEYVSFPVDVEVGESWGELKEIKV